jgi:3-deoxy-D-arabino-heptulosonate 7-phosphate (DAHP) synthase class II
MSTAAKDYPPAPAAWRGLSAGQQPEWPDRDRLTAVTDELAALPPLDLGLANWPAIRAILTTGTLPP